MGWPTLVARIQNHADPGDAGGRVILTGADCQLLIELFEAKERFIIAAADRIHAQSQLLGRRAERKEGAVE